MFQGLINKMRSRAAARRVRETADRRIRRAAARAVESLERRTLMSYSAPVSYPSGTYTTGMTTGDFNNDGHVDLVTSDASALTANVMLGAGDGTFAASVASPLG